MKKANFCHKQFQKEAKYTKMKKGQINITRLKFEISLNIASFSEIFYTTGLKMYYFFQNPKMDKWPNHFIYSKQFQKGQMATLQTAAGGGNKKYESANRSES